MADISSNNSLKRLALGFILLELLIVGRNWVTDYWTFYWFCDFAPIVFAVCLWRGNVQAAKGLMYFGFFGQLIFTLSFLTTLIFHVPFPLFVVDVSPNPLDAFITFVMHLSTLVVFFATLHTKPQPISLAYAFGFLVAIYGAVLLFTSPSTSIGFNYNYIYSLDVLSFFPYYTELWIPLTFVVVILPTYLFDRAVYFLTHHVPRPHHGQILQRS